MAEIDRREGPQKCAKYNMIEAEALEELLDIKGEYTGLKKRIAEL